MRGGKGCKAFVRGGDGGKFSVREVGETSSLCWGGGESIYEGKKCLYECRCEREGLFEGR